jgi:hypothetical protein
MKNARLTRWPLIVMVSEGSPFTPLVARAKGVDTDIRPYDE